MFCNCVQPMPGSIILRNALSKVSALLGVTLSSHKATRLLADKVTLE